MEYKPEDPSDSDSSESWTLLCSSPSDVEEANESSEMLLDLTNCEQSSDRDEDTDGISIISEPELDETNNDNSEESIPPIARKANNNFEHDLPSEWVEGARSNAVTPCFMSSICNHSIDNGTVADGCTNTPDKTLYDSEGSNNYDCDYLGDASAKLRTYVHKKNNKISTVLNIIVLGSVFTAAGIALGHIWGVKNECVVTPSINRILSNLYKLQEENDLLRYKIYELNIAFDEKNKLMRNNDENVNKVKDNCKRVFEEPLNSKNILKSVKCVDQKIVKTQPNTFMNNKAHEDNGLMKNIGSSKKNPTEGHNLYNQSVCESIKEKEKLPPENQMKYKKVPTTDSIIFNTIETNHQESLKENVQDVISEEMRTLNSQKREPSKMKDNIKNEHKMNSGNINKHKDKAKDSKYRALKPETLDKKNFNSINKKRFIENPFPGESKTLPSKIKKNKNKIGTKTVTVNKANEIKNNMSEKDYDKWYEKRAIWREEARKKTLHSSYKNKSKDNAKWYFRWMSKREQYRSNVDKNFDEKTGKERHLFKRRR